MSDLTLFSKKRERRWASSGNVKGEKGDDGWTIYGRKRSACFILETCESLFIAEMQGSSMVQKAWTTSSEKKEGNSFIAKHRWSKGFTLIELLIVISIIGILTALLMTGYKEAQERAAAAKCLSQLRTLAEISARWSYDNDGILLAKSDSGAGWQTVIESDLPVKLQDFVCPIFKKKYPIRDSRAMGYGRNRYFYNNTGKVDDVTKPRGRLTQISNPSKTIAFYENDSFLGGDLWGGYPWDGRAGIYIYLYPAHNDGFNVSFFDGHAEWVKFNKDGPWQGHKAGDYPQFIWKPY